MIAIRRYIPGYKQEITKTFIGPLAASLWMAAVTVVIYMLTGLVTGSNIIRTLIALVFAIASYFSILLILGAMTKEEIVRLPFGYRLYAVAKKCRLID